MTNKLNLVEYITKLTNDARTNIADEVLKVALLDVESNLKDEDIHKVLHPTLETLPPLVKHFTRTNRGSGTMKKDVYIQEILKGLRAIMRVHSVSTAKSNIELATFYKEFKNRGFIEELEKIS